METKKLSYAGHDIPVLVEKDICVIGGGTAGTAAAISASRSGAKVVVVEQGIVLGGAQTQALVSPMMPTLTPNSETPYVQEVIDLLEKAGIGTSDKVTGNVWFNPEELAFIYDDLVERAGAEVLFKTVLVDVMRVEGRITYAVVQTIQGLAAIKADVFIDASGDALLSRIAGIPTESGSEKTGYNQPMSFRFEMSGIDIEKLAEYCDEVGDDWCKSRPPYYEIAEARHREKKYKLEKFMLKGLASGELTKEDVEYFQAFTIPGKPGTMAMNCPELPRDVYRATDALDYSKAVSAGRKMQRRIAKYLIKHLPGFEKAFISQEAAVLGARETWRIKGLYYVTEQDYYKRACFGDAVARTAWFIDAHGEKVGDYLSEGEFYEIPYGALVTKEEPNLLVAGRCISVSFMLQASMRIQQTCMSIGEAAGIAAAWAVKKKIEVNEVKWDELPEDIRSYVSDSDK